MLGGSDLGEQRPGCVILMQGFVYFAGWFDISGGGGVCTVILGKYSIQK